MRTYFGESTREERHYSQGSLLLLSLGMKTKMIFLRFFWFSCLNENGSGNKKTKTIMIKIIGNENENEKDFALF